VRKESKKVPRLSTLKWNLLTLQVTNPHIKFRRERNTSLYLGLVKGASTGVGLGNKFLDDVRKTQTILQVLRQNFGISVSDYFSSISQ
jgi:GTPase involved in cell partitioning and DNA repair